MSDKTVHINDGVGL